MQVHGRRESFPLRTSNKATAADKAARIYNDIIALGWEASIAKYKPETLRDTGKPATVGALIEAACSASTARKQSLEAYSKAFRRVVYKSLAFRMDENLMHSKAVRRNGVNE